VNAPDLLRRAWAAVRAEMTAIDFRWRPSLVVAYATCALLLPTYHQGAWFNDFLGWLGGAAIERFCRGAAFNLKFVLRVLVPMVLIVVMRERQRDYGLGLGKVRTGLKMCGLFYLLYIPCFVILFTNEGFRAYYAGITGHASWSVFLLKEVPATSVLCLRTEFLYRGFLLFGVARHYGPNAGILVQIIPYVLMHSGKAPLEAYGSLLVGLALAYLALKTRSIWYGAVLHGSIALLFNALILLLHFMQH